MLFRYLVNWVEGRFFPWLYTRGAWAYAPVAWLVSGGRWRAWVRAVARAFPPQEPVLEIGFGLGDGLRVWAEQGRRAWGLDLSAAMARRAAASLRKAGYAPRLVLGRGQALPWPSHSLAGVLSTFPAPYIAAPETAREIARVLRPGGQVWLLLGAEGGWLRVWGRLVRRAYAGSRQYRADALLRTYAAAGLPGEYTFWPLPGGARGLLFRGQRVSVSYESDSSRAMAKALSAPARSKASAKRLPNQPPRTAPESKRAANMMARTQGALSEYQNR